MRSVAASAAASVSATWWPRRVSAFAASDARMRAPCDPASDTLAASSAEFGDPEPFVELREGVPGRPAGQAGAAQLGPEGLVAPPVAGIGGGVQGRLDAGAAGQQHVDQVEVGREGVAERAAPFLRVVAQHGVGQHEPAGGGADGECDRRRERKADADRREGHDDRRRAR